MVGTLLAIFQQPQWQEQQFEDAPILASEPEPNQRETDTFCHLGRRVNAPFRSRYSCLEDYTLRRV